MASAWKLVAKCSIYAFANILESPSDRDNKIEHAKRST